MKEFRTFRFEKNKLTKEDTYFQKDDFELTQALIEFEKEKAEKENSGYAAEAQVGCKHHTGNALTFQVTVRADHRNNGWFRTTVDYTVVQVN